VDDRSTDNTEKLVHEYMEKDKRIRYVKNTHRQGAGGARNQGIEAAGGGYIAFLDSDDEWMSFHLERMVYYLTKYPDKIDLMSADTILKIKPGGKVIRYSKVDVKKCRHFKLEGTYIFDTKYAFDNILRGNIYYISSAVYKKEIFRNIRFQEDLYIKQDHFLSLEIGYNKFKQGHLREEHFIYWVHEDNRCFFQDIFPKSLDEQIGVWLSLEQFDRKVLERFRLTSRQRHWARSHLAHLCFWMLGYNGYLQLKNYEKAKEYFLKGLKLQPFNLAFHKTYIARIILRMPPE